MNYETTDDPVENWIEVRRGYARQRLEDARAAVRQVAATVMHNTAPEWLNELGRCQQAVAAAEEVLAQLDAEQKKANCHPGEPGIGTAGGGGIGSSTKTRTFR